MLSNRLGKPGMGLIEIIIAVALVSIITASSAVALIGSFVTDRLSDNEAEATFYAQQGLEAIRSIRNQKWSALSTGTYGVSSSSGYWKFSGSSNTNGIFTRTLTLSSVQRNSGSYGSIVSSGGTLDPNTLLAASSVTWQSSPTRNNSVTVSTYLTNWRQTILGNWDSPSQEATFDIVDNANNGNAVAVSNDLAYLVAQAGTPNFVVVDVTNSALPTQIGSMTVNNNPLDICLYGNYAYVTANDNGAEIQVVNIANPNIPVSAGTYDATGNADGLACYILGSRLYLARGSSTDTELYVLDLTTPSAPSLLGTLELGADANDIVVSGNYAYIASAGTDELQIVNISSPGSMSIVTSVNIAGNSPATAINYFGSNLIVGRGNGDLVTFNISTPTSPVIGTAISLGNKPVNAIAVNSINTRAFVATDYTTADFQVVNISTPLTPVFVTSLDISDHLNDLVYVLDLDRVIAASDSKTEELIVIRSAI